MVRGLIVGVGSAAVMVAGLVGCSSDKKTEVAGEKPAASSSVAAKPAAPTSVASATSGTVTAAAGTGTAKVTIDGKPKEVSGSITCATAAGNLSIGIGDTATGIAVVMSPDASTVTSVGLGNVDGVMLAYQQGASGADASATKDGNTYTISGTATGMDMANPMQPTTKPFEIEVTCP